MTRKEWQRCGSSHPRLVGCGVLVIGLGFLCYGAYKLVTDNPLASIFLLFVICWALSLAKKRRDESVTCRHCHALAHPISGTGNRYRCDRCGNQFPGARHSF